MPALVWLSQAIADQMAAEAARCTPSETGGVLLGYISDGGDYVVTDMIGPGPGASHQLDWFCPDYDYQQAEIAARYEASGRITTYLGDWHSHPDQLVPALSGQDRKTLRRIAKHPAARIAEPLMFLLHAGVGDEWSIAAWQGRVGPRRLFSFTPFKLEGCEVKLFEQSDEAVRLRPASQGDVESIAKLYDMGVQHGHYGELGRPSRQAFSHFINHGVIRTLSGGASMVKVYACEKEREPIGFVAIRRSMDGSDTELWFFSIAPEFQKQGFGRKVLELAIADCQRPIAARTFKASKRMCDLLKGSGFVAGRTEKLYTSSGPVLVRHWALA